LGWVVGMDEIQPIEVMSREVVPAVGQPLTGGRCCLEYRPDPSFAFEAPRFLSSTPERRANSLGFNTGTAIWPPAFNKPASEVTSGAWAASASAANLRLAGSGTNPNASRCVEPPNLS
jgi:hypothetical protein